MFIYATIGILSAITLVLIFIVAVQGSIIRQIQRRLDSMGRNLDSKERHLDAHDKHLGLHDRALNRVEETTE